MLKRAVSFVLAVALLPHLTGCYSVRPVALTDVEHPVEEEVYGIVTVDGERVDFDVPSTDVRTDTIFATVDQSPYAIGLDQVHELVLRRQDGLKSSIVALVVVGAVAGIVFLVYFGIAMSQMDG